MVSIIFKCLLLLSSVFSVFCVLVGRLRQSEETDSNVVVLKRPILFPDTLDRPDCKTDHGYPGVCIDVRQCHAARLAIRSRNHPVRCGWINNYIPRVCCHPDQIQRVKMVFRPYRNRRRNRTVTS